MSLRCMTHQVALGARMQRGRLCRTQRQFARGQARFQYRQHGYRAGFGLVCQFLRAQQQRIQLGTQRIVLVVQIGVRLGRGQVAVADRLQAGLDHAGPHADLQQDEARLDAADEILELVGIGQQVGLLDARIGKTHVQRARAFHATELRAGLERHAGCIAARHEHDVAAVRQLRTGGKHMGIAQVGHPGQAAIDDKAIALRHCLQQVLLDAAQVLDGIGHAGAGQPLRAQHMAQVALARGGVRRLAQVPATGALAPAQEGSRATLGAHCGQGTDLRTQAQAIAALLHAANAGKAAAIAQRLQELFGVQPLLVDLRHQWTQLRLGQGDHFLDQAVSGFGDLAGMGIHGDGDSLQFGAWHAGLWPARGSELPIVASALPIGKYSFLVSICRTSIWTLVSS